MWKLHGFLQTSARPRHSPGTCGTVVSTAAGRGPGKSPQFRGVGVSRKVLPAVNLIPQVLTPQAEDQELIEAVNSPQQYLRKTENSITLV